MASKRKTLVLLDANHLMHRAYWAIQRNLSTKSGEQTNAVFGVASMLLTLLRREHPDAVVACFDEGSETLRHREHAAYKEGRPETPDDFYAQMPRVRQCFDAYGIPVFSHRDYEADDLIATLAGRGVAGGFQVIVVSGDRDLFQLVGGDVRVAIPAKGYAEPEYLDAKRVEEKLGVKPEQIPDYKGLVGDPSDNLKGVQGIGPKTAAELLGRYGTLESVYDHLIDIRRGTREKLKTDRESAFFCKKMAILHADVPIDIDLKAAGGGCAGRAELQRFFTELEFHTLRTRLKAFLEEDAFAREYFRGGDSMDVPVETASAGKEDLSAEELPVLD